jgi:DNA-binding response OmpR family regulator
MLMIDNPTSSRANTFASVSDAIARTRHAPAGTSVLVVEDEVDVRHLMTVVLRRAGYDVVSVGNLAEARAALLLHTFEAAVIDLCLPDGRGDQIANLVRAQAPNTRIVMTSAFAHASLMLQVAAEAGDTFVAKPFRNSDLIAALAG